MEPTPDLFTSMTTFVNTCMSGHDPSHNPAHVHRVVSLARKILDKEQSTSTIAYNPTIVNLSALLHDIGDRKYISQVTQVAGGTAGSESLNPKTMVQHALLSQGADADLAGKVQTIVSHVSYTTECADPGKVQRVIAEYPELAIVQDADRLDAIGSIGIGRCFTFLGAHGHKFVGKGEEWEMGNSIKHFEEKLERLEGMMKTQTGREMARVRTQRLREFRNWWEDEMSIAS